MAAFLLSCCQVCCQEMGLNSGPAHVKPVSTMAVACLKRYAELALMDDLIDLLFIFGREPHSSAQP
jgi:hypothetical protein